MKYLYSLSCKLLIQFVQCGETILKKLKHCYFMAETRKQCIQTTAFSKFSQCQYFVESKTYKNTHTFYFIKKFSLLHHCPTGRDDEILTFYFNFSDATSRTPDARPGLTATGDNPRRSSSTCCCRLNGSVSLTSDVCADKDAL
jgi:hypothetical protein